MSSREKERKSRAAERARQRRLRKRDAEKASERRMLAIKDIAESTVQIVLMLFIWSDPYRRLFYRPRLYWGAPLYYRPYWWW